MRKDKEEGKTAADVVEQVTGKAKLKIKKNVKKPNIVRTTHASAFREAEEEKKEEVKAEYDPGANYSQIRRRAAGIPERSTAE